MNIFVTSLDPVKSAQSLPDKHVIKMPVEVCQMLSTIASPWFHNYGVLYKKDGNAYTTSRGAYRGHPCTIWAAKTVHNSAWLLMHGLALCEEYTLRYGKVHACEKTLWRGIDIFPDGDYHRASNFVKAMPDEFQSLEVTQAYKRYIQSKPWAKNNYVKAPHRKQLIFANE